MSDIYSSASMVYVWLGFGAGKAKAAFQQIRSVYQQCRKETKDFTALDETIWETSNTTGGRHQTLKFHVSKLDVADWPALEWLFSLSWFQRCVEFLFFSRQSLNAMAAIKSYRQDA